MADAKHIIESGKAVLGIELGSTRIKAVLIDEKHRPIASGDFEWENQLVNGVWTYRTDGSEFHRDSLIDGINLSNETWGKLGYYFGGSNYFEHSYPVSVSTTLPILQNRFAFTPRFKSYNRDDMSEFEISIEDELEMPFKDRFFVLGVNLGFRYMTTDWEEEGKDYSETETDIVANANFRVNHTKKFYTEWIAGTALYFRPENLSNEYTDIYFGVNAHYVF